MIQINLIPDIKRDYLKAQRTKGFFIASSFLLSATSVGLVVLMALFVLGVQGRHSSNLKKDIDEKIQEIQSFEDIDKILTIQNQLIALPQLHQTTPDTSRLFAYLAQLTPNEIDLNDIKFSFGDELTGELPTVEVTGVGKTFKQVNTFADSLKNAQYTTKENAAPTNAFTNTTLEAISRQESETAFSIKGSFDPRIFDGSINGLKLKVPNITSSPSVTERPTDLFKTRPDEGGNNGQ